ncbi:MAG: phage holin family protein [Thermoanaerobaculia bacterium]
MTRLILRLVINAFALFIVTYLVKGITVESLPVLIIAALVIGLVNAIVKPIVFWLTLPLTVVTLGLFLIVINGLMLELAAWVVPGFRIDSFWSAMIGGLILGIISLLTSWIGKDDKKQ